MSLSRKLNLALAASLLAVGATLGTAQASEAAPANLSCAYGHFCGVDDYGHSFDVYKCGVRTPIGLSGPGEMFNNQTPGTYATWYYANGNWAGTVKSGAHAYIDWTPIWWVQAC
ncbi:hypothetical protein ABT052_29250 [Streptomyces sp. NPDC002766]|uniref:hypothetical protein n=1 Tax=Streptomyces sp. NPDC002766 TaxID=3154429 RepID=UPI00332F914D